MNSVTLLLDNATQKVFITVQDNCCESDRVLPYAPLLDFLRAVIIGRPSAEAAEALRPFAPELVKLLPDLGSLWPEVRAIQSSG